MERKSFNGHKLSELEYADIDRLISQYTFSNLLEALLTQMQQPADADDADMTAMGKVTASYEHQIVQEKARACRIAIRVANAILKLPRVKDFSKLEIIAESGKILHILHLEICTRPELFREEAVKYGVSELKKFADLLNQCSEGIAQSYENAESIDLEGPAVPINIAYNLLKKSLELVGATFYYEDPFRRFQL